MDFAQTLDPFKSLVVNLILSFATSPFVAPPYNLAISLFGVYAIETTEAIQSLQIFLVIISTSFVFDIVFMARHEMHGFIKFLTILNLIVKIPVALSTLLTLRQRGAQFSGLGNIHSADLSGPTLWSMPGGFSSNREGYQSVDEEPSLERPNIPPKHTTPPAPTAFTSPSQAPPPAPVPYQSV